MAAFRTDVTAFSQTLARQSRELERLTKLGSQRHTQAGRVSVGRYRTAKAEPAPTRLLRPFALELAKLGRTGKPPPQLPRMCRALRAHANKVGGQRGEALRGIADLGEAAWLLPTMWGPRRTAKGYPEYNPSQERDDGGQWSSGGGTATATAGRRMSPERAELLQSYRRKFGHFPPKAMPNAVVQAWVRGKAPKGEDVAQQVAETIARARANETWGDTFKRVGSGILDKVRDWLLEPEVLEAIAGVALLAVMVAVVLWGPGPAGGPWDPFNILLEGLRTGAKKVPGLLRWLWQNMP